MSFREKSAWITFLLLLVAFIVYFANAFFVLHRPVHGQPQLLPLFVWLVLGVVLLEIVMHALIAYRAPRDARQPKDERERLVELKSLRPAFYVLLVGGFLTIGTLHLGTTAYHMAHSVLLVCWVAELTRYGTQLFYYRRGV